MRVKRTISSKAKLTLCYRSQHSVQVDKIVTKGTILPSLIGSFNNANLLCNAPRSHCNQSGVRTAFPHSHWRHARLHSLGLYWWRRQEAAEGSSSSSSRLWRRVSRFHMHGTKRQDFTDEVTRSNVHPSRSSASSTTVLLRYLTVFFLSSHHKLQSNWGKTWGKMNTSVREARSMHVCAAAWTQKVFSSLLKEKVLAFVGVCVAQDKLL